MTNPDRVTLPYPATLSDLFRIKGKAELIDNRIVCYPLMGHAPAQVKTEILVALDRYSEAHPGTEVFGCVVYAVLPLPSGRQSFCPDALFHRGPFPSNRMSWIEGAPTFAVEIRVWEDYQNDVEAERAAKRADYFLAGTQVVWDVDPLAETIASYKASDPATPVVFRRGDVADAEPALPGWRLNVDDLLI
jgi:Uma2 family endonuclease